MESSTLASRLSHVLTPIRYAQAATWMTAMFIAETFFQFGSFTLEAVGFFLVWGTLYGLVRPIAMHFENKKRNGPFA